MPNPDTYLRIYSNYPGTGDANVVINSPSDCAAFFAIHGKPGIVDNSGIGLAFGYMTNMFEKYPWQSDLFEDEIINDSGYCWKYEAVLKIRYSTEALASVGGTSSNPIHVSSGDSCAPSSRMDISVPHTRNSISYPITGIQDKLGYTNLSIQEVGTELASYATAISRYTSSISLIAFNNWLKSQPDGFIGMRINPCAVVRYTWDNYSYPIGLRIQDTINNEAFCRNVSSAGYLDNKMVNFSSFLWNKDHLDDLAFNTIVLDSTLSSLYNERILSGSSKPHNNRLFYPKWIPSEWFSPWFTDYPKNINYGNSGIYVVSPSGSTISVRYNNKVVATSSNSETIVNQITNATYCIGSDLWYPYIVGGNYNICSHNSTPIKVIVYDFIGNPIIHDVANGNINLDITAQVELSRLVPVTELTEGAEVIIKRNVIVTGYNNTGIYLQTVGKPNRVPAIFVETHQFVPMLSEIMHLQCNIINGRYVSDGTEIEYIETDQKIYPVYVPLEKIGTTYHTYSRIVGTITKIIDSNSIELDNKVIVKHIASQDVGTTLQIDGVAETSALFLATTYSVVEKDNT